MFPNFKIESYPSRAAASKQLRRRCEANKKPVHDKAWKAAWNNYKIDAWGQIPPLPCIPVGSANIEQKIQDREIRYKTLAVKHFLPVFKARLPLLSGRAEIQVSNAVFLLDHWRQTLNLPEKVGLGVSSLQLVTATSFSPPRNMGSPNPLSVLPSGSKISPETVETIGIIIAIYLDVS